MGGKVLVPIRDFVEKLIAARLAADVMNVPTVLIARTDADAATLLTSDVDDRDKPFITGQRTTEGFYEIKGGTSCAIARGLAYAPYADLLWCETSRPDLKQARQFAEAIQCEYPNMMLAYNCSPSFNWKASLDDATIRQFQCELAAMGYKFQFITLAGFHVLNASMFELARAYHEEGMSGYVRLQQREFELEHEQHYTAVRHQQFVGAGYFDEVATIVSGGTSSTSALKGSTEEEQFGAKQTKAKPATTKQSDSSSATISKTTTPPKVTVTQSSQTSRTRSVDPFLYFDNDDHSNDHGKDNGDNDNAEHLEPVFTGGRHAGGTDGVSGSRRRSSTTGS